MKMSLSPRIVMLLTAFLGVALSLFPDITLTKEMSIPRNNDVLTRQMRSFVEPGDSGRSMVWDFSKSELIDGNITVRYLSVGDSSINKLQQHSICRFKFDENNLFYCGFEKRLNILADSLSAIEMIWPVSYGTSKSKDFYFKGRYSSEKIIEETGQSNICADATGSLILPDGDTINNTLRIRIKRLSDVIIYSTNKSERKYHQHEFVCHKWYAQGYRYPLAETISDTYYSDSVMISCHKRSYITSPSEQEYVTRNDNLNNQLRISNQDCTSEQSVRNNQINEDQLSETESNSNLSESMLENVVLSVSNGILSVSYQMSGDYYEMEMILSDTGGRVYSYIPKHEIIKGFNAIEIDCSSLPTGNYLLTFLYGSFNDVKRFSIK